MAKIAVDLWPIVSLALRSAGLVGLALLLIMVLLPAVLGAAGPPAPIGG